MSYCYENGGLRETLYHNLGTVCTIYTTSGEHSRGGITGVLSDVGEKSCKLIALPGFSGDEYGRCSREYEARRVHTIPIDRIADLVTSRY